MKKYKLTIAVAVLLTLPTLGYFIINGYMWLYAGTSPESLKMEVTFFAGAISLFINGLAYMKEAEL